LFPVFVFTGHEILSQGEWRKWLNDCPRIVPHLARSDKQIYQK